MIDAKTMKTIILTTLVVLFLVGGLSWITDQTGSQSTGRNRRHPRTVYVPSSIDQTIQIEIRPRIKSWGEVYDDISASVDRNFSTGIWSDHECSGD